MFNDNQLAGGKAFLPCALLITATLLLSAGCAATEPRAEQSDSSASGKPEKKLETSEVDPYENFNRSMFKFNDHVDDYVAKPISDAYLWVTPKFLQTGVSNFFSNLKDINVVLNDHMQGKFEQGAEDVGRFLTNSTVGVLGLIDVATDLGLKKHEEDFGQTLAVWGVPQGAYLVLPILGPTTARGVPGGIFDVAANPATYVGMPVQLVSMLNTRANAEGALKFIDEASIDPYLFTREAYLQNQQHLISDGKINANVDVLPLEDDLWNEVDAASNAENKDKKIAVPQTNSPGPENQGDVNNKLEGAVIALDNATAKFEETSKKLDRLKKRRSKLH